MSTKSLPATQLFRDFLGKFHSRKLLLQNPLTQQPVTAPPPSTPDTAIDNSLDSNVLMVLSVLFCGLICSIVLNSLFRFVLTRCSRLMIASGPNANSSSSSLKSSSGVMKKALRTFPVVKYSAELKLPGLNTECVVCLLEFTSGERVRLLPKCNHGFHIWCVDKWLRSHSSCPKCRRCLVETCEKIVGNTGSHASSSGLPAPAPVPETVVSIRPLDPEGISRNYGGLS